MTAKTKNEFMNAEKKINDKYWNYIKTSKAVLKLKWHVNLILDPHKYNGMPGQKVPTMREILEREKILQFEHKMESLNMFVYTGCKECHIESKPAISNLT